MNTSDSHEKIFPADPRITAFALGELEGEEHARIEAAVNADPELQAAVVELRAFGGQLSTALAGEKAEAMPPVAEAPKKRRGRLIKFPLHYFATALAACFAVVVWVRHKGDVTTPPPPPATEEAAVASEIGKEQKDVEHRLRVARKAAAASMPSPVSDASIQSSAQNGLQMPAMPDMPSVGTVSLGGAGFARNTVGTGAGYGTGFGTAVGSTASRSHDTGLMNRGFLGVTGEASAVLPSSDAYAHPGDNARRTVADEPLSTFSIDVDTASYANVRRFITGGHLPPRDAVRIEELINYFPYRYAPPAPGNDKDAVPFAAKLEVASAPWAPAHRLVRIGLKGREFTAASRPAANLVFLLDVSGSMNTPNKLPLVKESLRLLVERLRPDDRVAIVTYAGNSGLALPSTAASKKHEIIAALDHLTANGSTNGAMGIHLAYDIAKANFAAGGLNRVILCTDGDFNVGVTDRDELVRLVEDKAKSRVFLSVFGFGMGNLKDHTLESLSGKGNGTYGYIDTRREAEKVFVEQVEGTLATIAKDVKVQVEFNPARVASYRLIGYENRLLKKEDFNNDAVDAGDIGAGHTVTALYEIVPVGVDADGAVRPTVDALKYQKVESGSRKADIRTSGSNELLTVKIRYKAPEGDVSRKQEFPLVDAGREFEKAEGEFQFAAAVAAWGMLLRDSPHKGSATFEQVVGWAEKGLADDVNGHRAEFIQLVRRSAELSR
jgi:Ca-activated chloride channel family protein